MSNWAIHLLVLLLLPLPMLGVINKVKAIFAGRQGAPILQPVYDVIRLLGKAAVYSKTTSWVFVAGPIISLAATLTAGLLLPLSGAWAPFSFTGDIFLFAYLLGLGRFFTMAAALDTGSAFEGMGAAREAAFSSLAEPALFLCLMTLCVPSHSSSFAGAFETLSHAGAGLGQSADLVSALALGAVLLAECSRIPVDDPNTHLELTMIHEVMVLDHSGPDFAYILYGYAMKVLVLGALLVHFVFPFPAENPWLSLGILVGGLLGVAVMVGVVESVMARLRLPRVPQFLIGASVVAAVGLVTLLQSGRP